MPGRKSSFVLYTDALECIDPLDAAERGNVFAAILEYVRSGSIAPLEKAEQIAFNFIKVQVDRTNSAYETVCERNRANGAKGGRPRKQAASEEEPKKPSGFSGNPEKPKKPDNDNDPDRDPDRDPDNEPDISPHDANASCPPEGSAASPPKRTPTPRFVPPTVEDVAAYCRERGNNIDPEHFVAYYGARGWMLGKGKMKSWKQTVITWEKNDKQRQGGGTPAPDYNDPAAYRWEEE
jgi:hypothetical protein